MYNQLLPVAIFRTISSAALRSDTTPSQPFVFACSEMVSHQHIELEVVDDAQKESPASNVRLPVCVGVTCMHALCIFSSYDFVNCMFSIRSYTHPTRLSSLH